MQTCLWSLTFPNLINSDGEPSNLTQSLFLMNQSCRLSETTLQNSICDHFCSYQTLHLCWICVAVCFWLVVVSIFTGVGVIGRVCVTQPWQKESRKPIWRITPRFTIPLTFKTLLVSNWMCIKCEIWKIWRNWMTEQTRLITRIHSRRLDGFYIHTIYITIKVSFKTKIHYQPIFFTISFPDRAFIYVQQCC